MKFFSVLLLFILLPTMVFGGRDENKQGLEPDEFKTTFIKNKTQSEKTSSKEVSLSTQESENSLLLKKSKYEEDLPCCSAEDLMKHSVLVHLTNQFPSNGILIAGGLIKDKVVSREEAMMSRSTLHFSWNKPVGEKFHTDDKISDKEYCVLEPLEEAQKQWYGGFPEDIIIVGDYTLSVKSMILVPNDKLKSLQHENSRYRGKLIGYDSKTTTAAKSSLTVLKDNFKAWDVSFLGSEEDVKNNEFPIRYIDHNKQKHELDARVLFTKFFPFKYYGLHADSWIGIVDSVLIYLNNPFTSSIESPSTSKDCECRYYVHKSDELERALTLFNYLHNQLLLEIINFPSAIKEFLIGRKQKLEGWFNLLRKELDVRPYSQSIFMDTTILKSLIVCRNRKEEINSICIQKKTSMFHSNFSPPIISDLFIIRRGMGSKMDNPIFQKVICVLTHDEAKKMIGSLTGKLKIDQDTFKYIINYPAKGWRTKAITEEDLKPLM